MKIEYANALSNLYLKVKSQQVGYDIRYLYANLYPRIYTAAKAGKTSILISCVPPQPILDKLREDGYRLFFINDKIEKTCIDWDDSSELPKDLIQ